MWGVKHFKNSVLKQNLARILKENWIDKLKKHRLITPRPLKLFGTTSKMDSHPLLETHPDFTLPLIGAQEGKELFVEWGGKIINHTEIVNGVFLITSSKEYYDFRICISEYTSDLMDSWFNIFYVIILWYWLFTQLSIKIKTVYLLNQSSFF